MPHPKGPTPETVARIAAIRERLDAGRTLQSVADEFGLSRQRIHQIIHRRADGTSYNEMYYARARRRDA